MSTSSSNLFIWKLGSPSPPAFFEFSVYLSLLQLFSSTCFQALQHEHQIAKDDAQKQARVLAEERLAWEVRVRSFTVRCPCVELIIGTVKFTDISTSAAIGNKFLRFVHSYPGTDGLIRHPLNFFFLSLRRLSGCLVRDTLPSPNIPLNASSRISDFFFTLCLAWMDTLSSISCLGLWRSRGGNIWVFLGGEVFLPYK